MVKDMRHPEARVTAPADTWMHRFDVGGRTTPVAVASTGCAARLRTGRRSHDQCENVRRRLVFQLWRRLYKTRGPSDPPVAEPPDTSAAVFLKKGSYGKPTVCFADESGPSVSFSCGGDECWVAACGSGVDLGMDAASAREFTAYPFRRAFLPSELESAASTIQAGVADAAALVWSLKEAAVKALGCGFHLIDPLRITVSPKPGEKPGSAWNIHPDKMLLERMPFLHNRLIYAYTDHRDTTWLAFALIPADAAPGYAGSAATRLVTELNKISTSTYRDFA